MASHSETGHAINIAHFEDLISFCTGYGATYNPSKASIKLLALNTLRTTAQGTLVAVVNASTSFINATNERVIAFNPLKRLSTRTVNALDATDASDELVADAKTINRKIQGSRKGGNGKTPTPPETPETPSVEGATPGDEKHISVSQQNYDNLMVISSVRFRLTFARLLSA